jgi:hypothetical protein
MGGDVEQEIFGIRGQSIRRIIVPSRLVEVNSPKKLICKQVMEVLVVTMMGFNQGFNINGLFVGFASKLLLAH